jgi:phenylalanyl-tRNA synthetase alpha subunit
MEKWIEIGGCGIKKTRDSNTSYSPREFKIDGFGIYLERSGLIYYNIDDINLLRKI